MMAADLANHFPALAYLAKRAERRIPFFAWEYLASGAGAEGLVGRNRAALDAATLTPGVLQGRFEPDTQTELMGATYSVPFGAGPVGMSGLIWPGAELALARTARAKSMPYVLSTVANETPEAVAAEAGGNAWFQLYPPRQPEIEGDLLRRAKDAGVTTLVVTVDVPVGSRRERQLVAGLTVPPKVTPLTLFSVAKRPYWALAKLRHGQPRFKTLEAYFQTSAMRDSATMVGAVVDGRPDWAAMARLRRAWAGKLVVKGVLRPEDARRAVDAGADGIVVSNHGGRQFDAAPASIDALPAVAAAVGGEIAILYDGGVLWGLDVLKALARGADFRLLGRGFLMAVAALGERGGDHAYEMLRQDLMNNMIQLGARSVADVKAIAGPAAHARAAEATAAAGETVQ